jgi:hypothetical protein
VLARQGDGLSWENHRPFRSERDRGCLAVSNFNLDARRACLCILRLGDLPCRQCVTGTRPGTSATPYNETMDAFLEWEDGPEPMVTYEVHYVPRLITLSEACKLLSQCNDILGHAYSSRMRDVLDIGHQTYGAVARAMLVAIKERVRS